MRKSLLLGALALLATTGTASAVTTVALNGFCNAYNFRNAHGLLAMKDVGCSSAYGGGLLATVRGDGKTAIMALTDPSTANTQFEFKFSYPFVTGGTWTLYSTTDGVHFNALSSGTYTVPTDGDRGVKGTTSVTAK